MAQEIELERNDTKKLERWCKAAGLTPLEALARLWICLDEHREFIDDFGYPAKLRINRVEDFALDCRSAYWAKLGFFDNKSIEQLVAEQGVKPITSVTQLAGLCPFDESDFVDKTGASE